VTEIKVGAVDVYPVDLMGAKPQVLLLQRAPGARCTGAWEVVHGRIDPAERPGQAALRELREETGLVPVRMYSITAHPFYVDSLDTVLVAVTFAAVVSRSAPMRLGPEHSRFEWLGFDDAAERGTWPRLGEHLAWIARLLRTGDAGPAEDVLRIS
jgi:dATP pyrophosphohydrolase